jgi:hypothetical protein
MPDTDENMPLGYIVSEELFEVYAKKHGLPESSDITTAVLFALRLKIAPTGSSRSLGIMPMLNTDPMAEVLYLQVSGGKINNWKVDEEAEKEYCEELGLKFGERVRFKPCGWPEF